MAADDDTWVYDDPGIPAEAYVHRRLTEQSHLVFDDEEGRYVISIAAYRYADADGMSVYVSSEMDKQGIADADLLAYCSFGLARVQVVTIRGGQSLAGADAGASMSTASGVSGGVILREAKDFPADDERVRKSHGLVRIHVRPSGKPYWNAFRNRLIQGSEYRASLTAPWLAAGAAS